MVTLTYEYKLQPTLAQVAVIEDWLEICRQVYNFALAERKDWARSRKCDINACRFDREYIIPAAAKRPNYSQCQALAAAKQQFPELQRPHPHVLQQVLRQVEAAFSAMCAGSVGSISPKWQLRAPAKLAPVVGWLSARRIYPSAPITAQRVATPQTGTWQQLKE